MFYGLTIPEGSVNVMVVYGQTENNERTLTMSGDVD